MKLPVYPKYKRSGVEWLGDVPEHWEVKRSDGIIESEKRQVSPEVFGDEDVFHYSIPAVQEFGTGLVENGESIASAKQEVTEPVVLVSRLNPRKATICRAGPKQQRTLASTEFVALKARRCDLRFLEYLVSTELFRQRLDSWVQSVTRSHQRASPELIYRFWSAWPVPAEQRAIAAFLDRETGRMDALVAKKRELIERLKEKRTVLISRTVTRGLPPAAARAVGIPENPPLKPSGIEWLGDIPKHWEVRKFSRCAFFQEGPGLRNWQFTQDGIRVICVTNITEAGISFASFEKFISEEEYKSTYPHFTVAKGDLLLSSSGNSWGKVATFDADEIAILNTSTIRVNENAQRTIFRPLIGWMLTSEGTREQLRLFMTGSCQPNFGPSHLARVMVAVPPPPEQTAIAAYLDEETSKLDALVARVEEAVERLQEYRTALITAAVTGKIDVRHAALDGSSSPQ